VVCKTKRCPGFVLHLATYTTYAPLSIGKLTLWKQSACYYNRPSRFYIFHPYGAFAAFAKQPYQRTALIDNCRCTFGFSLGAFVPAGRMTTRRCLYSYWRFDSVWNKGGIRLRHYWLATIPYESKVIIAGNHDIGLDKDCTYRSALARRAGTYPIPEETDILISTMKEKNIIYL